MSRRSTSDDVGIEKIPQTFFEISDLFFSAPSQSPIFESLEYVFDVCQTSSNLRRHTGGVLRIKKEWERLKLQIPREFDFSDNLEAFDILIPCSLYTTRSGV